MIKYCLPIIEENKQVILETIRLHDSDYSFFEVWLDYVDKLDDLFISELIQGYNDKLLFVFRRKDFEKSKLSEIRVQDCLRLIAKTSDALIDLDFLKQRELLAFVQEELPRLKFVLSYHDFEGTPDSDKLTALTAQMKALDPYIVKISCMCASPEDALRLSELRLKLTMQGVRAIILGMGESGTFTRVFNTLYGNEFIFAPLSRDKGSAPGQLTRAELQNIFGALDGR